MVYEGSNNIEMHYGPSSVTQAVLCYDGDTGTMIYLSPNYDFSTDNIGAGSYNIYGNPTSPTFTPINTFLSIKTMSSTIPNTRIYKFTKSVAASLNELNSHDFDLYPNPSNQFVSITSDKQSIVSIIISDISGKQVKSIFQDFNSIDLSEINSGIYFAQIKTENGSITKKFVKK
ncbi:T9SS type A sorting domain-containing protein [Flavobacteriales bacterium]|nr:T9SS type A sorting domain-containing protein [Flavobacteriales bacterium]